MNRILTCCLLFIAVSLAHALDAPRSAALATVIHELESVRSEQNSRAVKIGDQSLQDQVAKRHETLVAEWNDAVSKHAFAPGGALAKWHGDLSKSLATMKEKKKEKAASALQDKIDYIAWLLGKADARFDGGQHVALY